MLRQYRVVAGLSQEELAARAGLSPHAVSALERGVNRRPYPSTVRQLAEALGLGSEQRAALTAAAHPGTTAPPAARAVGVETLQISPSARTVFTAASQPLDTSAARPPAHPGPVHSSSLVGRKQEVALLERHLGLAGPPLLLLAGEPGIGKTRLLHEATTRAPGWGLQVLAGGCQRRGGQEPYAPLLEALERFLQGRSATQRRADLEGCTWLARLLPELVEMGAAPMPAWTLTAEQERRLMFKAVARLLTNVAGPGGTLLVLDDLQWAGADALDLLATLVRTAAEMRLRVLGAYRDTEVHPEDPLAVLLADLAHAGLVAHQTLVPLAAAEATQLLDDLLESTVPASEREQVLQRTGGVPFFLVSCVQTFRMRESDGGPRDAVPWDIVQGIRQRVAILPPAARELVNAAAVVGRSVPRPLLLEVVIQPEAQVLAGLEACCRARLLEEAGDDAYQFAHDVIHEVVRGDLGAAQRAALHRRTAEVLERRSVEPPVELLAYHYDRAGEYEQAISYLITAAERARHRVALREVVGLLAQAITLAERLGQRGRAAELRAMRGEALCRVALWAEARVDLESSLVDLRPERVERRAEVLVELARAYWWLLDCPTSGRFASEALDLADKAGRDDLALPAIAFLAQVPKSEGRMMQSRSICLRGLARPGGDRNQALLEVAPLVHYLIGQTDEAIRLGRVAVETIRATRSAADTVGALSNLGLALAAGGQYDEAMRVFEAATCLGREYEVQTILARAMACATGLHLDVFDYPGAEANAWEAYEMARSVNWSPAAVSAGIDLLVTFVRSGEVGRADALLDEVVRLSELPGSFHEWQWRIRITEARAELALAHDNCEQAWRWINESLRQSRISRRTKYRVIGLGTRARIYMRVGQVDAATADLRRALKLARLVGDPAQFLRVAAVQLQLDGDDLLAAEARASADRIVVALSDERMRRRFRESDVVRTLERR